MKVKKYIWLSLALSLVVTSQAMSDDKKPTPEERAYEFRHAIFETLGWKMGRLVGAKMGNDAAGFKKHAKDMEYLASMIEEGFQIENSIPEGSIAKPEIWTDFSKFEDKANILRTAAGDLSKDGAMESFNPRDFGSKNCGGCHRDFREKK